MKDQVREIAAFFDQYASGFNHALGGDPDVESMANAFAEHFIEASPAGVTAGSNTDAFKEAIAGGLNFYRSIGIRSMEIISRDVKLLDRLHALVKIHWRSVYEKPDGVRGHIEFDVLYLVQDRVKEKKIFAYVTGDEQKVLQQLGLISAATDINQRVK